MTPDQIRSWFAIEGITLHAYTYENAAIDGSDGLWEACVYGKSSTLYMHREDNWSSIVSIFDGGPEHSWDEISDEKITELYDLIQGGENEP